MTAGMKISWPWMAVVGLLVVAGTVLYAMDADGGEALFGLAGGLLIRGGAVGRPPASALTLLLALGVVVGCAGPAAGSDPSTIRAHRAEVSADLAAGAARLVRVGRVEVMEHIPDDDRLRVDRAFQTTAEAFEVAAAAAEAARDVADAGEWQAAMGCAAAALGELLQALEASGVTSHFSALGRKVLTYIETGLGFVPGRCEA